MVMFVAFGTRLDAAQFTTQVVLQCLVHGPRSTCDGLDAVLLEETQSAVSHASSQHHVGSLAVDKGWYLPRGVVALVGIINLCDSFDLLSLHVNHYETGTPPEVGTDQAIQAVFAFC